ncbi:hypothetical protein CYLTODRAFT_412337 [Cylindrobasidium torrendii FP15055 ss-10]|uniref:Uncharacterized protein n=1 Tax=Cylindrobasidium torrendii FP15055 ss-10 TaxID=1314674 RepID=A0A0D7B5M2_9AGAR|nr:hypothetical protein CYLTODRAFT_412337 [Cylindrobasidium torrendii FP15055 ss-10]
MSKLQRTAVARRTAKLGFALYSQLIHRSAQTQGTLALTDHKSKGRLRIRDVEYQARDRKGGYIRVVLLLPNKRKESEKASTPVAVHPRPTAKYKQGLLDSVDWTFVILKNIINDLSSFEAALSIAHSHPVAPFRVMWAFVHSFQGHSHPTIKSLKSNTGAMSSRSPKSS